MPNFTLPNISISQLKLVNPFFGLLSKIGIVNQNANVHFKLIYFSEHMKERKIEKYIMQH